MTDIEAQLSAHKEPKPDELANFHEEDEKGGAISDEENKPVPKPEELILTNDSMHAIAEISVDREEDGEDVVECQEEEEEEGEIRDDEDIKPDISSLSTEAPLTIVVEEMIASIGCSVSKEGVLSSTLPAQVKCEGEGSN